MRRPAPLTLLVAALVLGGCSGDQSVLDAAGSSAAHLKHLIVWVVAICSLVWAAVMMALIWALFRRRPGDAPRASGGTGRLMSAVSVATAVTVAIIAGFTVASFLTTRSLSEAASNELAIKVSGQQWWWKISYLDPSFDTANEIHIPVGRNVRIQLEASDVIHSFWVPSLAGKQDLIPGRSNELTIRAERAGLYRGQCAEFCGLQHSHMAVLVIAEPPADFEQWAAAQRREAAAPVDPEAAAGKAVFSAKPCAACHAIRGTEASGTTGPDLTHVGGRRTIAAGLFETTRGTLAAWTADPQTAKPGNNMPLVPLSSDELRQVSAYLAGLK